METEQSRLSPGMIAGAIVALLAFVGLAVIAVKGSGWRRDPVSTTAPQRSPLRSMPTLSPAVPLREPEKSTVRQLVPASATIRATVLAEREGRTWKLDQLRDHLADSKLEFQVSERRDAFSGIPGIWLTTSRGGAVLVEQFPDPDAAQAAKGKDAKPSDVSFVWGRFLIIGRDSPLIRAVIASLPQ
jgi:hypothetical protein